MANFYSPSSSSSSSSSALAFSTPSTNTSRHPTSSFSSSFSSFHVDQWSNFLSTHSYSQSYLWQYWKSQYRSNEINKKLFRRFEKKNLEQREIKELIRQGIPPQFRGAVWWACSGGAEKAYNEQLKNSENSYEKYLIKGLELSNRVKEDIFIDLNRTFSSEFGDEKNILPLKNILLAYSIRNKEVGYCQSMNFMVALLLIYLNEEQTFWVLSVLIEDILPDGYYANHMIGCRVDQAVFQSCLAWKLPNIFTHLKTYEIDLTPITSTWLISLFINILPLQDVLRIWDCLLWEGDVVLLRMALSIVKLLENEIFDSYEFSSVCEVLRKPKGSQFEGNNLMITAYDKSWLGSIPRAKLAQLRLAHKESILQELAHKNNLRRERALWAVKWSISSPTKEAEMTFDNFVDVADDEIDLSYQDDFISSTEETLMVDMSTLPTERAQRDSVYNEAENVLQKVLTEFPDTLSSSSSSTPISSPKYLNPSPVDEITAIEEQINTAIPHSPPDHQISQSMARYLSEPEI